MRVILRSFVMAVIAFDAASFVLNPKTCQQSMCTSTYAALSDPTSDYCVSPLGNCQSDQWHIFCNDEDHTMEGLVSPAPESFYVLHSAICRINNSFGDDAINMNDLNALSSYLVKPNYAIELYKDMDVFKWRLIPRSSSHLVHPLDFVMAEDELYHKYNALELSRMALDVATSASRESGTLDKVHEIAIQAEVGCFFVLHIRTNDKRYICSTHNAITDTEKIEHYNGFRLERLHFLRYLLQLCPCWITRNG